MNTNTQDCNDMPKPRIGAAMFVNFLSIGVLGALYFFYIASGSESVSGSGRVSTQPWNKLVQTMEVQNGDNVIPNSKAALAHTSTPDVTQNTRNVVIGSTASQIEDALNQCKQFSEACEISWYEDELERTVTLQPFAMDKYEVTVAQFARFAAQHRYTTDAEKLGMSYRVSKPYEDYAIVGENQLNWRNTYSDNTANLPVVHVTQKDAEAYCESVQKRLPTEAEWEYVAGGQERFKYPWGQQWDDTKIHWGTAVDSENIKPIASFPPTLSGHYDLAGSVSEWTATKDDSQKRAFIKGASRFDTNVANARVTVRRLESIDYSGEDVGFRCVQELINWPFPTRGNKKQPKHRHLH